MSANFWAKPTTLTFLAQISPKVDLGLEIQKTNIGIKLASLRYHDCQFSGKTNNFDFFDPNLPKNGLWGQNIKNLCAGSRSAPPRDHVCQFSVKMYNFEFFALNLGKLTNYVQ